MTENAPEDRRAGQPSPGWDGFKGWAVLTAANAGGFVVTLGLGSSLDQAWYLLAFFPVISLAWSVPLIVGARRAGRSARASGMIVASALLFLAWATCWFSVG